MIGEPRADSTVTFANQLVINQLLDLLLRRGHEMYHCKEDSGKAVQPHQIVEDNYIFIHPRFKERFAGFFADSPLARSSL